MSRRRMLFAVLILSAGALQAAPQASLPAQVPDTLAQRLLACASCHARIDARGNPVNDSYFPRISGKPAGYLYNQLLNFREGRRQYPLMTYLVDHLPDAYLREIAGHFAAQPPAAHAAEASSMPAQLLERGRQLVMQGDSARRLPACVACHGQRLTGVEPTIPGLLGLPRDYVNAQFGAWRNKARRAHAPDCMAEITARLTLEDVNAVSHWLAAQPTPSDPRPAASIARPLPLACGSATEAP
ncbi:c-type cytochrome [Massilia varians]|uniref:c-type cytochrome n=1 Tax=Massilia varians TaxID=457921 RepID=UPI00255450AB|nr:c-type cytochrome [Massilia varians]MDK6080461.1 c-type cytochrome [Massilia varians]